jgi:hypothetical protein
VYVVLSDKIAAKCGRRLDDLMPVPGVVGEVAVDLALKAVQMFGAAALGG